MILFHSGIIKGKITYGKLKVIEERIFENAEEYIVDPSAVKEFLEDNDFRYTYNKKTGTISFTKNFMDNNLEDFLALKGIRKTELARRINVNRSQIGELCKSKNIEIETAYKVLAALSLEPEDINAIFPMKNRHLIGF